MSVTTTANQHAKLAQGAYCSLEDLVAYRYYAKGIKLRSSKRQNTLQHGNQRSHFRNRGLEFEEVRQYQAGDDIRTIDWRVTARSGKAHTKLFREERERPLFILIDQRLSTFIGSKTCFKSVFNAHLGALIAWAGLHRKDRIGGIVFNDNAHTEIRAFRSNKGVLRLLNETCNYNQQLNKHFSPQQDSSTSLNNALKEVQYISHTGASIYIISDFKGFNQQSLQHISQIARHNQLHCFHITDLIEKELPNISQGVFSNGIQKISLNLKNQQFREAYQESFDHKHETLKTLLGNYKINYAMHYTHESPLGCIL